MTRGIPSLPFPAGALAPGTLTPTLSLRERGSEGREMNLRDKSVRSVPNPTLSPWEKVAEDRVRAPQ